MSSVGGPAPRGVVQVGDRIRFDDGLHHVAAIEGTTVRLVAEDGRPWLAAVSYLAGSPGFAVVDAPQAGPVVPPFALLDALPEQVAEHARAWESHVLEVITGFPGTPAGDDEPRPDYDPRLRTLSEREAAKAAELTAAGENTSAMTVSRMRHRYETQGLWGLVDHRNARPATPFGGVDQRVAGAIAMAIDEQTGASTGTRERAWRAEEILAARYPGQQVPLPSRATFYRVFTELEGGRHTFGSAVRRRSNANRPLRRSPRRRAPARGDHPDRHDAAGRDGGPG